MAGDRERSGDWTGDQWAPDETPDTEQTSTATGDTATSPEDHWVKTQYVGDRGEGAPAPVDPDTMPEGDTSISGRRHTSGEQHFGDGQATTSDPHDERSGDRPLERP